MIPKIIHQIWMSADGRPMPDIARELCQTWQDNHPEYDYRLWDNHGAAQFLAAQSPAVEALLGSYPHQIQKIDALKYLILAQYGGLYVDIDYECVKPVSSLFSSHECYLSYESDQNPSVLGNGFIASTPQSPFMLHAVGQLGEALAENQAYREDKLNFVLSTTGPGFLTRLYEQYGEKKAVKAFPTRVLSPLRAHESREIVQSGKISKTLRRKMAQSYAIHYSFTMWL